MKCVNWLLNTESEISTMIILLSPAKTLDFETPPTTESSSQPAMLDRARVLVDDLKDMSAMELSSLMDISDKLAELNRSRYANWEVPFSKANAKQALLAFKGDVYVGLDAESLSEEDLEYAQRHLRILSGLYGVLRPLDLMQPYRLEMGTKLQNDSGNNLYAFWGDSIADNLNAQLAELQDDTVVNLASVEYFKSVDTTALDATVISPVFRDLKNGTYKIISFYAKKARGLMARWIIQNRIESQEDLVGFNLEGYRYSDELSSAEQPTFIRDEKPS
jgi:cytoplasmic iron level regulating protein YaaA (DUF328/UPF0246 family)